MKDIFKLKVNSKEILSDITMEHFKSPLSMVLKA